MIKIKQAVIVEGKYDKIKLSTVLDTVIIQTDGFGIFKDKEKQKLIKRLAQTRGIVILTDSDSAGFKIRSFIGGSVPKDSVIHAYIPDVFGKERRKDAPSKEGKLGVEGIDTEILLEALNRAGVTCESTQEKSRAVTVADLYEAGLCHFQCMKELHPAKTVAHAHGHHHRSAVFSAAPTVVCCRAGHSLLLLLRCKYRKFFRKSSFSAGILFCVKKWAFLSYK